MTRARSIPPAPERRASRRGPAGAPGASASGFDATALVPAAVAAVLYAPAAFGGFALDDRIDLLENRFVTGPFDPVAIFGSEYYAGWGHIASGHYRPLLNLTYAVVAGTFGLTPAPFHVLNVVLFAGLVALTARIAARLSGSPLTGMLAGLLLAVHPIVSESVAAIAGLKELAAAGLGLAALSVHLKGREIAWAEAGDGAPGKKVPGTFSEKVPGTFFDAVPRKGRAGAAAALFLAALLFKESALALLGAAVAAEFLHERAPAARRDPVDRVLSVWPLATAAAMWLGLRVAVTGGLFRPTLVYSVDNPLIRLDAVGQRIAALGLLPRYLALVVWPSCLSSDYSDGSFPVRASLADPWVAAGILLLAAFAIVFALAARNGWRTVAFGIAVFGAGWLLVSHLVVPIGTLMAERLFLVPFWGLAIALAAAGTSAWRGFADHAGRGAGRGVGTGAAGAAGFRAVRDELRPPLRTWSGRAGAVAAVVVLGALAACTALRIPDWTGNARLAASVAACHPDNLKVLVVRAETAAREGRADEARALLDRAGAIRPDSSWVQAARGHFLQEHGDTAGAERALRACAEGPEPIPGAVVSLAMLYLESDRPDEAARAADRALAARPSYADAAAAHLVRGEAALRRGDVAGAEAEFRLALNEDPGEPAAHFNLGRILESRSRWTEALGEFVAAEARAPRERLPAVLTARARAEEALGLREEAERTRRRALHAGP